MAKYQKPKGKLLRAVRSGIEGEHNLDLFSGVRPIDKKCKFEKPPGKAEKRRGKQSEYAMLMCTKQAMKRYYGVLEKQFKNLYKKADKQKGSTGDNLITLLEKRLDNVVFRSGFASTRAQARQMVSHGHVLLNGKRITVASYQTKKDDNITLSEAAKKHERVGISIELAKQNAESIWIDVDYTSYTSVINDKPNLQILHDLFKVNHVVELYSK